MTILVVDDDESVRTGLRCVLVSEGYDVGVACNGAEAVQELARTHADLILVDMNMPVQNGWATIAGLRRIEPHVPIIIITARPDQHHAARAAGLELMEKPLELPFLIERIAALIEKADNPANASAA
jgi:DNA-binding response OmpR family regulator